MQIFLQKFYKNVPWVVLYQTYLFCYNLLICNQYAKYVKNYSKINSSAYMWSLPIWRKSPDMAPPFTPSRRGSKNPDIYEFRFFAFAKS